MNLSDLHYRVASFLFREATLLDEQNHRTWLDLLSPQFVCEAPIRISVARQGGSDCVGSRGYYFRETKDSLIVRVDKLFSGQAYAEDPPSFTRRIVTNIQLQDTNGRDVQVRSNFVLFRSSGEKSSLLCGERLDNLKCVEEDWRLLRRIVLLSHNVLPGPDLPVFL